MGDFSRKQSESQGFEIPKKSHPKATSAHIPPAKFNLIHRKLTFCLQKHLKTVFTRYLNN